MTGISSSPFPKPSPAEHLPLEQWLSRTDRAEVGREPFFRGRDKEYDVFRRAANILRNGRVGGGTMIFQGAPGVGKTALMGECMEAVRCHSTPEEPWVAVAIKPGTLRNVVRTVNLLVNAVIAECDRFSREIQDESTDRFKEFLEFGKRLGRELSERGDRIAGFSIGGKADAEDGQTSIESPEWVFTESAPLLKNFRLVVLVDEAQNITSEIMTQGVIQCLYDPPADIPLVATFFGLSDTEKILGDCGLTQLPDERVVNMESLAHDEAASAIRGAFEAYRFVGMPEDQANWVDRLAELSQGWPQHVNRVSVGAARVIQKHGGRILMEHLEEALQWGRERNNSYYNERLDAGPSRPWVYRQLALEANERDGSLSTDDIELITEGVRRETLQTLDDFLTDALHAGLLAPVRDIPGRYRIPIASLGDYLRALPEEPPP